jgi:HSP20 family molecular chaperone IbpA
MAESRELKVREKQELSTPAEQTTPGPVFTPEVDIFETEKEITLLADVPGVTPEGLNIDLRDNVLTIAAEVKAGQRGAEEDVLVEYQTGRFFRQFTLSEVIDQARIDAKLADGVLRLGLPKVEKATPRRISIKTG